MRRLQVIANKWAPLSTGSSAPAPAKKMSPVAFGDSAVAHGHKSILSLLRSAAVLRSCRFTWLTKNAIPILKRSEQLFGPYLTYQTVLRWTFFKQFCAGEDHVEVKTTLKELEAIDIGSILDFAAEADAPTASPNDPPEFGMKTLLSKKVNYNEANEKNYDENMKYYLLCVGHASLMLPKTGVGFAAVKISGLCDPQLLSRVTALQLFVRQAWVTYVMDRPESEHPLEECRVVGNIKMSPSDRFASHEHVGAGLKRLSNASMTDEEVKAVLGLLDPQASGKVDYLRWCQLLSTALLETRPSSTAFTPLLHVMPQLTDHEKYLWSRLRRRLLCIVSMANELSVRVMIDAEQTFYQMAIDHLTREFQRKFNKKHPIVYNTYQCYLTITHQRVQNDMLRAEAEGWVWAGKMVRGAYMLQERQTAAAYHYKSPIWDTKELTDKCYHDCSESIFQAIEANPTRPYGVLFGTHSRTSVAILSERVRGMKPNASNVSFAQLLGMSDDLTVPLARAGYTVFKYVPYGPVRETVQYLARRALENGAVLSGDKKEEMDLIWMEIYRRFGLSSGK